VVVVVVVVVAAVAAAAAVLVVAMWRNTPLAMTKSTRARRYCWPGPCSAARSGEQQAHELDFEHIRNKHTSWTLNTLGTIAMKSGKGGHIPTQTPSDRR
jgi:hypothetical protein